MMTPILFTGAILSNHSAFLYPRSRALTYSWEDGCPMSSWFMPLWGRPSISWFLSCSWDIVINSRSSSLSWGEAEDIGRG